ncbi:MAG: hypothetical protein R3254_08055, partial [Thiomicrorhabdus sp.]|nr:hypothetical protein [Thiomicrorhabdus sp.]
MKPVSKELKKVLLFTVIVSITSISYFIYAFFIYPPVEESETFFSEIGEGFGEIGLWLLLFIYARTVIKLILGR